MKVEVTKNTRKYESYKYGFEKIQQAIEAEFFLEAIMIAESIISDRLLSYLVKQHPDSIINCKLTTTTSFHRLIQEWQKIDQKVSWKQINDLIADVDEWRKERNHCAHSLAKSNPGTPTKAVNEFVIQARICAIRGKILATSVCNYTQKRKREIERKQ